MNDTADKILAMFDSQHHAEQIAAALGVTKGRVYAVLREHRPDRERKPRRRVSALPARIRGYHSGHGIEPSRIAVLLGVSRQYVHKILSQKDG